MDSGGMLPSSTRSCSFIWARRERESGDFFCENRLKLLFTLVGFGRCFCEEGVIVFQRWYAFLVWP